MEKRKDTKYNQEGKFPNRFIMSLVMAAHPLKPRVGARGQKLTAKNGQL